MDEYGQKAHENANLLYKMAYLDQSVQIALMKYGQKAWKMTISGVKWLKMSKSGHPTSAARHQISVNVSQAICLCFLRFDNDLVSP